MHSNSNIFKTDWLGSTPVYYNERTKRASHMIGDVIDYTTIDIHPEGFNNYLRFGYSVFGQTPLRDVKYLPHSSRLEISESGTLTITHKKDVVENYLTTTTNERDVLDRLAAAIATWEKSTKGDIILPLSGGFDSRLLNYFITDKTRVRAFTYGTSNRQAQSFEVRNAERLAHSFGESWQHIELQDFLGNIAEWEEVYGVATHAHGMYQMEFYKKLQPYVSPHATVLSGIIGDAWAGSVKIPPITSITDVAALGYSHGMHADPDQSRIESGHVLQDTYFQSQREKLQDPRFRVVEAMRFKMVLLSYLLKTPAHYGFAAWSPFIDPDIALSMLMLPTERRLNREWQRDFFRHHTELAVERHWCKDRKNTLNLQALERTNLEPLSHDLLEKYVRPEYITNINDRLAHAKTSLHTKRLLSLPSAPLYFLPGVHTLPTRLGIDPYTLKNDESRALNAYLVLHPIQTLLRMRR